MDRNIVEIHPDGHVTVALRKESVDRNLLMWYQCNTVVVALRKESVDRNPVRVNAAGVACRRSPQGERG